MSNFCTSCGAQVPDGAYACPGCGAIQAQNATPVNPTPTNTYVAPAPTPAQYNPSAPAQKSTSGIIGMVAVGIIAIIVIALIASIFGGGYKKPIKNLFEGIEKSDWKKFSSAFPEERFKKMEKASDGDDYIEGITEMLEDDYGKNIKISFKIKDKEKLDKDDIEDLEDDYEDTYEEKIKIKKLEVESTVKGKDDKDTDTADMVVGKIGLKWYILEGGMF